MANLSVERGNAPLVDTVRNLLLEHFPSVLRPQEADVELTDALYCLLRAHDVGVSVDGWNYIRIVNESQHKVEAVGLMALLPDGSVPVAIHVETNPLGLVWDAQFGRGDGAWHSLSESKRWRSVYLYATGGRNEPDWVWNDKYQGVLTRRTPSATVRE